MKKTIAWIVGIIIVIVIIIAATRGNQSNTGPIRIGFIGPLTGDAAAYGLPYQNTIQLAVDEVNAAGGINGRPIQIIFEDGKCNGTSGATAAQKLVSIDKVQVIIGGFCSGETVPVVPIAEKGKVLVVSPGASSPTLTNISSFFFRTYPSDASQGKVLATVANSRNMKLVAFIKEQTDYADGVYGAFDKTFQSLGGKTISEAFMANTTDFKSSLAKLRSQNPDALFIDAQTPASAQRIATQIQQSGWKIQLFISDGVMGDKLFVSTNAKLIEGAIGAEFYPPTNPKYQKLLVDYKTRYNQDLPYENYMTISYDTIYLLKEGISAVGYDGVKLAAWSRTIKDWQGASGVITIGADGDRVGGHLPEIVKNGKTELLSQ